MIVCQLLNSDTVRSFVLIENLWSSRWERWRTRSEIIVWFLHNVNVNRTYNNWKKKSSFAFITCGKPEQNRCHMIKAFWKALWAQKLSCQWKFSKRNRREKLQVNESEALWILTQRLISRYDVQSNFINWSQWLNRCLTKYLQQIEIDKNL